MEDARQLRVRALRHCATTRYAPVATPPCGRIVRPWKTRGMEDARQRHDAPRYANDALRERRA